MPLRYTTVLHAYLLDYESRKYGNIHGTLLYRLRLLVLCTRLCIARGSLVV